MTSKITRTLVATAAAASVCLSPALLPTADAAPTTVVAQQGSRGTKVTTIQTHLHTLKYYSKKIDGVYGSITASAVKAFQKDNKLPITGIVDQRTYDLLSSKGTAALNAYRAQKAAQQAAAQKAAASKTAAANRVIAKPGDQGTVVKQIQGRLSGLGYLPVSSIIGKYGPQTTAAVKAFQKDNKLPVTGVVDGRTNDLIIARYKNRPATPAAGTTVKGLDPRCYVGRTVCVNKTTRKMYWVVNGKVIDSWSARVGRPSLATREGTFTIYLKSKLWHSTLYHVDMPYTQFFSGGQAIHYSADFARNGYAGAGSHGCVNMRDKAGAAWLYSQTRVGDRVVVYR